jgi:diguanylate cyclase (GGDEF)-like protein
MTILDVRIVLLLSAVIPLVLGALMVIYRYSRRTYPGFGLWVLANFTIGLGYILLGLRGRIPDFFPIILGNALALYSSVLIYDGVQLFFGRGAFDLFNSAIFGLYIILQLYLTYFTPNINARILLASSAAFVFQLRIAASFLRDAPPELRRISQTIGIIFILSSLVSAFRAMYVLTLSLPVDYLSDKTLAALSFASVCSITIWTFYFFFLNSARLEFDLEGVQQDLLKIANADRHKVTQLALLEETSRSLSESLDEKEIMERAIAAVVSQFGYAEAAISLLVEGDILEVAAIGGTEDIGFKSGYRQKIGEGIIGHTAKQKLTYISNDIEHDSHFFSIGRRSGSAVGVPMLNEGQLLGALYVESTTRNAFNQGDVQTLQTLVRQSVAAIQKARLYARVQAQLQIITTLHAVSQTILSSLELQEIFQSIVQSLKDKFNYTYVSIYLIDDQVLRLGAQAGYPQDLIYFEIPLTTGITGRAIRTKQTQFIRDVSKDPDFLRAAYDIESEICVPLIKEGNVLGILNVEAIRGHPLTEDDVAILTALTGPVAIAVENARLHTEVKSLALTDGLTNLYNRRAFDRILESEVARALRYDSPLTLIMIDVDSFKELNDQRGHPAGDERLKAVADLLKSCIRSPDVAARYGGDEFALILPNTLKSNAVVLAERLRANAETSTLDRFDHGIPIPACTFSIGVATFPEDGRTAGELLLAADQAELAAKKLGKNRVCLADNGLSPSAI